VLGYLNPKRAPEEDIAILTRDTCPHCARAKSMLKAAGLRYFHVPYDGSADPKAAEAFLSAITTRGAEPAFIHCAGGNRAATMWLIKRVAVDHWDVERATKEATLLGQTNAAMRQFAVDYAQAHKR